MGNINLSAKDVCKQLFEGNSNSIFEISKVFDQDLLNKEIKWTGILDDVSTFNYDFIFKNKTGVKALIKNLKDLKKMYEI
jgi:hypothetical protein